MQFLYPFMNVSLILNALIMDTPNQTSEIIITSNTHNIRHLNKHAQLNYDIYRRPR